VRGSGSFDDGSPWRSAQQVTIQEAAAVLGVALLQRKSQRCPLPHHTDQKPSFSFDWDRNLFHCFGCGCGGSTIEFVAAIRECTKAEARDWLLANLVQSAHPPPRPKLTRTRPEPAASTGASAEADTAVLERLLELSPLGSEGFRYLASRAISKSTAETFRLGQIGPREVAGLLSREFGATRVADSGVLGGRGKLCFPVGSILFPYLLGGQIAYMQARGSTAGAARWMGLKGVRKLPYNLDALATSATIFLVEGAVDVLSAHELGLVAVGLPGAYSALPEALIQGLRGKLVYIVPDKDFAGGQMAERIRGGLRGRDIRNTIQALPRGNDLNDFLRISRGLA
jgi:DNA primase